MAATLQRIFAGLLALSLVACATNQKIALNPEVKRTVKHVALIDIPEPSRYTMNPGKAPGVAALYIFGALGGAVVGGIEAARFEKATARFNEAVAPQKPNLSALLVADLELGLKQKGYEVTRVPPPPLDAEGKNYDVSKIEGSFDAVLIAHLGAGYSAAAGKACPQVTAAVSLVSPSNSNTLFSDTYVYSSQKAGGSVQIAPDAKFILASVDDVYVNITVPAEGMKEGTNKIAERILDNF